MNTRAPMALIPQTWSVLLMLLAHSFARKPCMASSSAGPVVQLGSSFQVVCTFIPSCRRDKTIFSNMVAQSTTQHNLNTIYLNVTNIRRNSTYTCKCHVNEPCGVDVYTGYPPAVPKNLTCTQNGTLGDVVCSWERGRETHLLTSSKLWVLRGSGNITVPESYQGVSEGSGSVSAWFRVSGSVQSVFSVWVMVSNRLGSAESSFLNFTLNDIVRPWPPLLARAACYSLGCVFSVEGIQEAQNLEVQYRTQDNSWITYPLATSSPPPSLQPYMLYEFRARCRFRTGLWSDWSGLLSNITEEDVPFKAVDVWYTIQAHQSIHLHWKKLNDSEARGKILFYEVIVHDLPRKWNASTNHLSVPLCTPCEITVFGVNSKGRSPPGYLTVSAPTAPSPQNVSWLMLSNHSIAISWQRPVTAEPVLGYLVEWYPAGRQVEELRWLRLGPEQNHTTITDNIRPYECYAGAVHAVYKQALGRAAFIGVHTLESAPTAGPTYSLREEGARVTVTSLNIPHERSRGCVIHYDIYIYRSKWKNPIPSRIATSDREHTLSGLAPGLTYSLRMSASTASGEGPQGDTVSFSIRKQQETSSPWFVLLLVISISVVIMVLMYLCHSSAVQQRVFLLFHCLMPDVIPDPANSKWAKECANEKGKVSLHIYLRDSSVNQDPDTVEVQELPEESWSPENVAQCSDTSGPAEGSTDILSHLLNSPGRNYPQSSYLKSLSQQSDESNQTQASQDTAVVYISSHGLGAGEEEQEEEEEDAFFPCSLNVFMEPLGFGGKLTLDTVRIDCSEL